MMRSRPVEYFIISLIILYTLLVIVYLAIDNIISDNPKVELGLQIFELVLLFIFCVETLFNFVGFGMLFIKDYWNLIDILVILLAIVLVCLDITLKGNSLDALLRLRGLFRLVRIGILLRKFDAFRKKNAARKKMFGRDFYHVMAPSELVNNIL